MCVWSSYGNGHSLTPRELDVCLRFGVVPPAELASTDRVMELPPALKEVRRASGFTHLRSYLQFLQKIW